MEILIGILVAFIILNKTFSIKIQHEHIYHDREAPPPELKTVELEEPKMTEDYTRELTENTMNIFAKAQKEFLGLDGE